MRLIYLASAKPDLAWYRLYYRSIFPEGAKRASAQYLRAIVNLENNPNIGRPVGESDLRKYSIPRLPFAIVYRVTEEYIEVVRIWDQRSDPAKLDLQEEASVFT